MGQIQQEEGSRVAAFFYQFSTKQNKFVLYYKELIENETRCFLDNHKKSELWVMDMAKLLAVVLGATLLGILFVKSGFPETNIVVIYIFAVLLVARFTKGYFYGTLSYSGSQWSELPDNLLYHVDYSTDYQCPYDKGIQQLEKEQIHRSITGVDEIRRKFTNPRTEYLENEENWAFPVNGQNRILAVIMIARNF